MDMTNAIRVCTKNGGYKSCNKCPLYVVCSKTFETTEEWETAMENAAVEHLKKGDVK